MDASWESDSLWSCLIAPLGDLTNSATAFGAVQRWRAVKSGSDLLRSLLAYAAGDLSLRGVSAWCEASGLGSLSQVAFFKRLKACEAWLEHLLALALKTPSLPAPSGLRVLLVDATVLCGPKAKGTEWRVHSLYDPEAQRISALELTDAHGGEGFWRFEVGQGDLLLGDSCYGTARGYRHLSSLGAHALVRITPTNLRVLDAQGKRFELAEWARCASSTADSVWLFLPDEKDRPQERVRLVRFLPPGGRPLVLLTSLQESQGSDAELAELYRVRWQIELLFKRLKSLAHLKALPSKGPTARAWILARLLFAALSQMQVALADPS